mgnify:CR=1 FL=1
MLAVDEAGKNVRGFIYLGVVEQNCLFIAHRKHLTNAQDKHDHNGVENAGNGHTHNALEAAGAVNLSCSYKV